MQTYLFAWNPERYEWTNLDDMVEELTRVGHVDFGWSCGNRKDLPTGSRCFLIRLGKPPKGIIGSGVTRSGPKSGEHWDEVKAAAGMKELYVVVRFDFLARTPLITWDELKEPPFSRFRWGIQASGVKIPKTLTDDLETLWGDHLGGRSPILPDEVKESTSYPEGAMRNITVNAYERSPQARNACIACYGYRCRVCGVLLEEQYGTVAAEFIHVHHIVPLSSIRAGYKVNPTQDLIPVCPNCHAVIHRTDPPLTVEKACKLLRPKNVKRLLTARLSGRAKLCR